MRSGAGNPTSAAVRSPTRLPAAGPGWPVWQPDVVFCWADDEPAAQCWEHVDPTEGIGLCEKHRREIVGQ